MDADLGKTIKVRVFFTDDADNEETLTSAATAAVAAAANTPVTGAPTISDPEAYVTVEIKDGDDTVSWSDPGNCSSDYNLYLAVTPPDNDAETARTHLGSAASGSDEATQAISHEIPVSPSGVSSVPRVEVELYCGEYEASSLVSSTRLSMGPFNLREGTYSSVPLTALTISSGTLSPSFDRGIYRYAAEVPSDTEAITLEPAVLTGFFTVFVKNPGWGIVSGCWGGPLRGTCNYGYGDGTTTGIILNDAGEDKDGFQIDLGRGENRLGIGVNTGNVDTGPGELYYLTITVQNSPATELPTISGTAQLGETLTAGTSSIGDADGLDNATFTYQWLADGADIDGATGSSYTLTTGEQGKTIKVRVSFTDDAGHKESLTSEATAEVEAALTAELRNLPESGHNGEDAFTFRILFSEDVTVGYQALKEDSFEISDGTITRARRVNGRNDLRQFTVVPSSSLDVVMVLPSGRPCEDDGAICTSSNKRLSNRLELTVPGPAPVNAPATGSPTISGTARVDETLTADTSGISDEDGLSNATFGFQWVSSDGNSDNDISGATGSSLTLADADLGKTVKVRVSFTDDAGNDETLTSAPTGLVEARANSPATGAPSITGTVQVGETLTADTSGIADSDGLGGVTYSYQWLANDGTNDADIEDADSSTYTLDAEDEGKTIKVRVSFTDDAGNGESLTSDATTAVAAWETPVSEPPPAPTNLTAVVNGDGSVTLSWDTPDDDSVAGYQILRRRPAMDENTLLVYEENTGSTATTFTDTDVTAGTRHVYRVKAINDTGLSNWSNYVRVEP